MAGRYLPIAALLMLAGAAAPVAPVAAQDVVRLSLKDAEDRAVQSHPQIRAAQYSALAAGEAVREVKSAYFPTIFGSFTGAQAQDGSAIAAGTLNSSAVANRFSYGVTASQLITDFGRTPKLATSASLTVDARQQDVIAEKATVLLEVDRAYFDVLRAQAVEGVAEQTVAARQLVVDQVSALAAAGLKSTLDLSFARVNLAEAQLLLVQTKNDVQGSYARLSTALGASTVARYELSDQPLPEPPPGDAADLIAQAMRDRPDVTGEREAQQSEEKFAAAEGSLWLPTLSLVGAAGRSPYHQVGLADRYSAIGLNVTLPLTNGNLYSARRAAATFRASSIAQSLRDLEDRVTRDVQTAWLDAQTSYQRLDLTNQLLSEATDALDLAQQRYNLGLSSIVELTQAQLNQTEAQIQQATAKYDYQARNAALRFQTGALK